MNYRLIRVVLISAITFQVLFSMKPTLASESYPFLFGKVALSAFEALKSKKITVKVKGIQELDVFGTPLTHLGDLREKEQLVELAERILNVVDGAYEQNGDNLLSEGGLVLNIYSQNVGTDVHFCTIEGNLQVSEQGGENPSLGERIDVISGRHLLRRSTWFDDRGKPNHLAYQRDVTLFETCKCELKARQFPDSAG